MDVFLYFYDRLPCGLDEIEDRVDVALGHRGEVVGSGSGSTCSNIDIEVADCEVEEEEFLQIIRSAPGDLELPKSSVAVINNHRIELYQGLQNPAE